MASLTGVPYRDIIIAAIPALFYFFCLFLSIIFQARKQNIKAIGELTDDMRLNCHRLHPLQIFAPVLLVLVLLLTPKDLSGKVGFRSCLAPSSNGVARFA